MSVKGYVVAGRFEVEEEVGGGAAGMVYRARDAWTGETVALKLFEERTGEDLETFARHCAVMQAVRDPTIVKHIAFSKPGDVPPASRDTFLVMEWIDGEHLRMRLDRSELMMREAIDMVSKVAGALGELHRRGIAHMNLKPDNLLLPGGDPGRVKLADRRVKPLPQVRTVIRYDALDALIPYLSPEHSRTNEGDARSDVFALGAILFRCVAGRVPFEGTRALDVMEKICSKDPAPRLRDVQPETPRALCDVVAAMLAKKPQDRPADGSAVALALAYIR